MPVKAIGDGFAQNNKRIKKIVIPEGFISIGESAFEDCSGLTSIELPKGLTFIGYSAFQACTSLKTIKLPKGFIHLNWIYGFSDYTGLREIIVDENNPVFCSLDGVLFDKAMTSLLWFPIRKKGQYSVPDGIVRIMSYAFGGCEELTGIYFPQSLLSIESSSFNSKQLTDITVNELNPRYCSIDGVLFDKKKRKLILYPVNKDKTEYTIPEGIIDIANKAFCGCKRLANVGFPESLELIGSHAFSGCKGLKAINLPVSLQYIGELSFEYCPNLETVTLSRKTKIGYMAFEGFCGKLVYRD